MRYINGGNATSNKTWGRTQLVNAEQLAAYESQNFNYSPKKITSHYDMHSIRESSPIKSISIKDKSYSPDRNSITNADAPESPG